MQLANFLLILPEITLSAAGLVLLLVEAFLPAERRERAVEVAGVAVVGALAALATLWKTPANAEGLGGMIWSDGFGLFFRTVLLIVLVMVTLTSVEYVVRHRLPVGEFYALLFFATVGGMLMSVSGDLIMLYVGLELLSLSSYALVGLLRQRETSLEASLKYFLNGALASALLLFGLSLLFGLTGTTSLREMAALLGEGALSWLGAAALVLVAAGLGFKLAVVPFHLWVPDTYQGAPTPVSAFLAVASEGAAVAAILRAFFVGLGPWRADWSELLAVLAVLTMTVGNVAALHQRNAKRLLAYSSISHAGFILAGIATGSATGFSAAMFYVLAYAFMNVGAFAVVAALANQGEGEELDDLAGLARREPILAFLMLLFVLSLLGIPPLAGFWAKLYVFRAAVDAGRIGLAVAVALNSAVAVAYYYGILRAMYVAPAAAGRAETGVAAGGAMQIGLALAAAGVLVLGLFPEMFIGWVTTAAGLAGLAP